MSNIIPSSLDEPMGEAIDVVNEADQTLSLLVSELSLAENPLFSCDPRPCAEVLLAKVLAKRPIGRAILLQ